ncbi:hypothetical protein ASD19_06880 [Microbacterium sp. Root53]|uniref:hypothetical protein n=1 Tax=Microbacterium sp. Root53 TaxID=1736553 RepID=UPI0006FD82CA|nr:hypothetical protein [Microbacterium sp. Root53]KQY98555.1 hypothetical protein ASD19_06880 [Microbacterium sp. Root53]
MSGLDELFADDDHDQPIGPATPKARPTTDASFAMQFADATSPGDIARANPGPMRRGQQRPAPEPAGDSAPTAPLPRYGRHEDSVLPQPTEPVQAPQPRRARGPILGGALALLLLGGGATTALWAWASEAPAAARAVSTPEPLASPTVIGVTPRPTATPSPSPVASPSQPAAPPAADAASAPEAPLEEAAPVQPAQPAPSAPPVAQPSPTGSAPPSATAPAPAPSPSSTAEAPASGDDARTPTSTPRPSDSPDEPESDGGVIGAIVDSLFG